MTSARTRRRAGLAGILGAVVAAVTLKTMTGGASSSVSAPPAAPAAPVSVGSSVTPGSLGSSGSSGSSVTPVSSGSVSRTLAGAVEETPYGAMQASVTLDGSRIRDVTALHVPHGGRSSEIASFAVPELRAEVLKAQGTRVDAVSGASYDTQSYLASVQSALDRARR